MSEMAVRRREFAPGSVAPAPALAVYSNGVDRVVAASAADAVDIWEQHTGWASGEGPGRFEMEPGDKLLTIHYDDAPAGLQRRTLTMQEWAREEGRGFLCSIDY